jgi:hypothetical protein
MPSASRGYAGPDPSVRITLWHGCDTPTGETDQHRNFKSIAKHCQKLSYLSSLSRKLAS